MQTWYVMYLLAIETSGPEVSNFANIFFIVILDVKIARAVRTLKLYVPEN